MTRPGNGALERNAARAPVPSPCISVCRIEADSGLCEGCLRTLDEIARWGALDDAARLAILDAIDARRIERKPAATARSEATSAPRSVIRRD